MAKSDLLVRIKLLSSEFDTQLKRTRQQLDVFGNAAKSIGNYLKRFGAAFLSVDAVVKGFSRTMEATQTTSDAFHREIDGAKAGVDAFFASLSSGDWGNFLSNIETAIAKGRELYDTLDTIGDKEASMTGFRAKAQYELSVARATAYDPNASEEERAKAKETIKKYTEEYKQRAESIGDEYRKAVSEVFAKSTMSEEESFALAERYILDVSDHTDQEYKNFKDKLDGLNSELSYTDWGGGLKSQAVTRENADVKKQIDALVAANKDLYKLYNADKLITDSKRAGELVKLYEQMYRYGQEAYNYSSRGSRVSNYGSSRGGTKAATITAKQVTKQLNALQRVQDKIKAAEEQLYTATGDEAAKLRAEIKELQGEAWKIQLKVTTDTTALENLADVTPPAMEVKPVISEREKVRKRLSDEMGKIDAKLSVSIDPEEIAKLQSQRDQLAAQMSNITDVGGLRLKVPDLHEMAADSTAVTGEVKSNTLELIDSFSNLATSVASVGRAFDNSTGQVMQWVATLASSIGRAVAAIAPLTAANKAQATSAAQAAGAQAASSVAGVPIAGPLMAVSAIAGVVAALASIPKFAEGGIVGGASYHGDKILARLNSGELILNKPQQQRLSTIIDRSRTVNNDLSGRVEFIISGQNLKGILTKQDRRNART